MQPSVLNISSSSLELSVPSQFGWKVEGGDELKVTKYVTNI